MKNRDNEFFIEEKLDELVATGGIGFAEGSDEPDSGISLLPEWF